MSAKRFQIYLDPSQYKKIRQYSLDNNLPMAAVIRSAVDLFLQQSQPSEKNYKDPFWSVVGLISDSNTHHNEESP